ncbi:uncharacterized protein [Mytilus edulis]|uniref:uncharacterized protein n=1 Tax=Mytilus edulis TaxID=6550 RepID=UPI0039EE4B27
MDVGTCDGCNKPLTQTTYCVECTQCFCAGCTKVHTRQNATKSHILLRLSPDASGASSFKIGRNCEICEEKMEVVSLCASCREMYCTECSGRHHLVKATKDHQLCPLKLWDSSLEIRPASSVVQDSTKKKAQVNVILNPVKDLYRGRLVTERPSTAPGETAMTRIRGMTILQDGRLLVIDSKNKCLKVFKPEWYELLTKKELTDEPRGIAAVSQDEVVITFADKKEVRIYKIDKVNNLWKERSFGIKDKPFSISYSRRSFAIELGEGDDGEIAVTDFNGNITHLVRGQNSSFGQFTGNTIRLVHDNDRKLVFIANVSDGYIHCVDYKGEVKWVNKINTPRGVALHEHTLFVASKADNKIYQINATNGHMYSLLSDTDRINQPRYIAVQATHDKLAVEVGSSINVYTISKK